MSKPSERQRNAAALLVSLVASLAVEKTSAEAVPGRIAGSFDTTSTGGAAYAIPIPVAAGMNGMRPVIALAYNSQGGDGFAGAGWSLSGLSEITRCGRTMTLDGIVQGIRLSSADRFCLDGQPLLLVAGTHARDGAEYRLQVHRYERIVARGAQGSGPRSFDVYLADGSVQRYGSDETSRVEAAGTAEVRAWAISEVQDRFGQRMAFRYAEDTAAGEHMPDEIRWSYSPGETFEQAPYRLLFEREPRPTSEVRTGMLVGTPWRVSQRLRAIRYEHKAGTGFAPVHRYDLAYAPATSEYARSRLASVTQCGPTSCLPPTRFDWDEEAVLQVSTTPLVWESNRTLVDLTGDGVADLLAANSPGKLLVRDASAGRFAEAVAVQPAFPETPRIKPLDFNGDGVTDLVVGSKAWSNWFVYVANASSPGSFTLRDTGIRRYGDGDIEPMDVDGDQLDDLVYIRDGSVLWHRNTGGAFTGEMDTGIPRIVAPRPAGIPSNSHGAISSGDFDGDGRGDVVVARPLAFLEAPEQWQIHLSTGTGFRSEPFDTLHFHKDSPWQLELLDINGDGLSDVVTPGSVTDIFAFISTGRYEAAGDGLAFRRCPNPAPATSFDTVSATDTDGDGRSEIWTRRSGQPSRLLRPSGECFVLDESYEQLKDDLGNDLAVLVGSGDVTGDGKADLLLGGGSTSAPDFIATRASHAHTTPPRSLTRGDEIARFSDGLGNVHDVTYRALGGWSGYRLPATSITGTRPVRGGPLTVVEHYSTGSGKAGERYTATFRYAGARISTVGRNLLSFDSIQVVDSRNGLVTETLYRADFPFTGYIERRTIRSGTTPLSDHDPTWGRYRTNTIDGLQTASFVHLLGDTTTQYDLPGGTSGAGRAVRRTSRQITWNFTHGAISTERVAISSPLQTGFASTRTRQVTFDDAPRLTGGCLGLPARIDLTAEVSGLAGPVRTTQFVHDPSTCRLISQTSNTQAPASDQLRMHYSYDVDGRLYRASSVDVAAQGPSRTIVWRYESSRFRASSESQLIDGEPELATTSTWDDALGVRLSSVNAQGKTTSWLYDEFGRTLREQRPAGSTATTITACGPCFAPGARYSVRQLRSDGYWSESQHDGFGRVVGSASVLADGRGTRQLVEYDGFGRVARQSMPFVEGDTVQYWRNRAYDLLGRPTSVTQPGSQAEPEGSVTTISYDGLATIVRDPANRQTLYQTDAAGRIVSIQTPLGGGASYAYDAYDQLIRVTDPAGHSRDLEYDSRGFLVRTADPDAGTRTFAHNAYGELVRQADGKSPANVTSFEYDQLGRMTRRTEAEGATRWVYSAVAGPSRGLLTSVTGPTAASPAGFSETYVYSAVSRPRQTTTVIDGASYVTDVTYDAEGKMLTMTYPATVGWRPRFVLTYSLGHLVRVSQENPSLLPVYSVLETDARGRDVTARYGSNVIEERTAFDPATGRLLGIRAGLLPATADLQDLAYQWDMSGNLLMRQDRRANPQLTETFSYDALDRLTGATASGMAPVSMAYSVDGNILSKSDTGTFLYGSGAARPHGVAAVSGGPVPATTYTYDINGNMTSGGGRQLDWTSFNMPRRITQGADQVRFSYGPARTRIRQDVTAGGKSRTIHHVGPHFEVEIEGDTRRYRSNVFAYGRAVYTQVESSAGGLDAYYVLHDHAGSLDQLVRAAGPGIDRQKLGFDAWGKRRNEDWSPDPTGQRNRDGHLVERGYTGHEHLDPFQLIHMNGRLQDPVIGRMISPDPVLGNLLDPQELNPYSYVANNPASYTDPSGYSLRRLGNFFRHAIRGIGSFARRLIRRWGNEIGAVVGSYYAAEFTSGFANRYGLNETIGFSFGTPGHASNGALVPGGTLTAEVPASVLIGSLVGGAVAGGIASGTARGAAIGALTGGLGGGVSAAYAGSYSAGRVLTESYLSGGSAEASGGDFGSAATIAGGISALTWAATSARRAMIEQSLLASAQDKPLRGNQAGPPAPLSNATGRSFGFRLDLFKLGGCRLSCDRSVFGGVQGGEGRIFGIGYSPGSFIDALIETYAGPHDALNAPIFYGPDGNNVGRFAGLEVLNFANVFVATPFAAASVIPAYAYGAGAYVDP